mgnify:CR=1 FL=1
MVPEIAVKALPTHCNFAALVSKSVHHMGFTSAMTNFCFDQRHLNLSLLGMVGFFIRSSTVRLATSARSALINSSFSSDAPVQLPSRLRFAPEAGIPPAPLFRGASGSTLPRPRAVTDAPSISVRAEAPASAVLARALLSTLKAFSSQTIRRMGHAASLARHWGTPPVLRATGARRQSSRVGDPTWRRLADMAMQKHDFSSSLPLPLIFLFLLSHPPLYPPLSLPLPLPLPLLIRAWEEPFSKETSCSLRQVDS